MCFYFSWQVVGGKTGDPLADINTLISAFSLPAGSAPRRTQTHPSLLRALFELASGSDQARKRHIAFNHCASQAPETNNLHRALLINNTIIMTSRRTDARRSAVYETQESLFISPEGATVSACLQLLMCLLLPLVTTRAPTHAPTALYKCRCRLSLVERRSFVAPRTPSAGRRLRALQQTPGLMLQM